MGKVYDLYQREGSARHLAISIPHAITVLISLGKAVRKEPNKQTSIM
jgi:hypothetical protein